MSLVPLAVGRLVSRAFQFNSIFSSGLFRLPGVCWYIVKLTCICVVLAVSTVQTLHIQGQLVLHSFAPREQTNNGSFRMLRGWAAQLLGTYGDLLLDHVNPIFDQSLALTASASDLFLIVQSFCDNISDVNFVLDGLDEYPSSARYDILYILRQLPESAKVIVFSRETPEMDAEFLSKAFVYHISTTDTAEDVHLVIRRDLVSIWGRSNAQLENPSHKQLEDLVSTKAKGLHLFARHILDSIKSHTTMEEVQLAIEKYPPGLCDVYQQATSQLDSLSFSQRMRIKRLLQLMLCCCQPMDIPALRDAISVKEGMTFLDVTNRVLNIEFLLKLCRPLLKVDESSLEVVVPHESIRDFFLATNRTDPLEDASLTVSIFHDLSEQSCHSQIVSSCLSYLMLGQVYNNFTAEKSPDLNHLKKEYPFLPYAALYWSYHLANVGAGKDGSGLADQVATFLLSEHSLSWIQLCNNLEGKYWGGRLLSIQADLNTFLRRVSGVEATKLDSIRVELISLQCRCLESTEASFGKFDPRSISMLESLGYVYRWSGDNLKSLETFEELFKRHRTNGTYETPSNIGAMNELGMIYLKDRLYQKAIDILNAAHDLGKKSLGDSDPTTLKSLDGLANVYQSLGRFQLAKELYTNSLVLRTRLAPRGLDTLVVANNLAFLLSSLKEWEESERLFLHVVSTRTAIFGQNHVATLWATHHLGAMYMMQGKWDEGIKHSRKAHQGLMSVFGESNGQTIAAAVSIARYHLHRQEYVKAVAILEPCLKISEKRHGNKGYEVREMQDLLAKAYYCMGRLPEAVALKKRILKVQECNRFGGPDAIKNSRIELEVWTAQLQEKARERRNRCVAEVQRVMLPSLVLVALYFLHSALASYVLSRRSKDCIEVC